MSVKRGFALLAVFIILVLSQPVGRSQSDTATVTGRVVDPLSASIPNTTITVLNVDTQVIHKTVTNNDGLFTVPGLLPGNYRIEAAKIGFKTVIKPGVVLNLQDVIAINFNMTLGSVTESVTVEEGASMINTTNASVSTVVDQTFVKNMPLNGRSFQDLILLTPGTVTQSSESNGFYGLGKTGEFSVNGQRPESNYYTVDGVSANVGTAAGVVMTTGPASGGALAASTALGTTHALVSVDALQEFRVQSSTYSAEYGRTPGGQFSFETKSGTNQWHGTAYDYLRNGAFDANDWFNDYFGTPEPALRQNDFGGTLGGRVMIPQLYDGKDRTFFFVSYEGLRLTAPQAATPNSVPDLCMRGVNVATSCPQGRNPAASALEPVANAFPVPSPNGLEDAINGVGQFIGSWSNPSSLNSTAVRFDQVVTDKLRLFFRFSDTGSWTLTKGSSNNTPSTNHTSTYTMRTYTAGVGSVFSKRVINDFRLNYSSNEVTDRNDISALGGSTPLDFAFLTGAGPGSSVAVGLFLGGSFLPIYQQKSSGTQRQWNLVDTVSLSSGRHQFIFGGDYRRLTPVATPYNPSVLYLFFSEADVETNSPFTIVQALAPAYPLYTNFSTFAQDEWRISHRLTLSLGLRWEVNPAPGVTQGLKAYALQGSSPSTWALAPQGTPLWRTTWYNLAPRVGGAYILGNTPGRETVVRGGAGVFFDTGQQLGAVGFSGPGFFEQSFPAGPFPGSIAVPAIVNPPMPPYSSTPAFFSTHLQLPYTLQWNASVEQAVRKSQTVTLSYVGAHSSRLLQQNRFSTPGNPNSSTFDLIQNGLTADYSALQLQYRRRLTQSLAALASYTWSHCLDFGSQNYLLGAPRRGNCDFDVRHNVSAAFSYDLPNVGHSGFLKAVLHHWGFDDRFTARSSFPVSLAGNTIVDPTTGKLFSAGLNLVPGQPVYLYGANCDNILQGLHDLNPGQGCPGGRAINPNAFVSVNSGRGDAPRNFARGFGAWQMNLAVRREFPIHENMKLQFRAETFNVFNHPSFGSINANCGDSSGIPGCTNPQFGQATATLANSLGVLSPLYQMGGPRSMQFALKLIF